MSGPGGVALGLRLVLAAVFAVAAVGKLTDAVGSRRALSDFGVPAALLTLAARLLPALELAVAVALVVPPLSTAGALAALSLLLVFTAAVGRTVARGESPDCHCFGQVHTEPAGWTTLGRNAVLAVAAIVILAIHRAGVETEPGVRTAETLAGLTIVAAVAVAAWRAARRAATKDASAAAPASNAVDDAARSISLAPGGPAPGFTLPDLDGRIVTLDRLCAEGRPVLLVFSDPACGPCAALLPEMIRWDREHNGLLTVAVVSRGTLDANMSVLGTHRVKHWLLQKDREVAQAYRAVGTPAAVLVSSDRLLASPLAGGIAAIRSLVATVVSDEAGRSAVSGSELADPPAPSSLAPDFTRVDLDGRSRALGEFRGRRVLLLFWSPSCGYCMRMLRHLQAWESLGLDQRPELLVISSGDVDANRACGFQAPVLIDQGFSIGRRYGARGTPSAVLIDDAGLVASEMAVGQSAILGLIGFRPGAAIPATAKPARRDGIEDELLSDGSIVAYHGEQRRALTLNATAALVWECCDGQQSVADIANEVASVFPSVSEVHADVRELLDRLVEHEMIVLR